MKWAFNYCFLISSSDNMTFVMCYRDFRGLRLCCYNVPEVSESVILFAMFLTKGVIAIVIGKPIANVVKNMSNHF